MGRKKNNKTKVTTVSSTPEAEVVNPVATHKLFCYGTLNLHEIQKGLWGEMKQGRPLALDDYELKQFPEFGPFYIEPKFGERVSGKVYEITYEQLLATDKYETSAYERVLVTQDGEAFNTYIKAK